jgi:hypothetical protein
MSLQCTPNNYFKFRYRFGLSIGVGLKTEIFSSYTAHHFNTNTAQSTSQIMYNVHSCLLVATFLGPATA